MDICLGYLAVTLKLDEWYPDYLRLLRTGGCYLLSGFDCLQTGQNDLEHTQDGNPGRFMLLTGALPTPFSVFPSSHRFMYNGEKDKMKLTNILKMEERKIPRYFMFVGNGSRQHAWAPSKVDDVLRYHRYVVPEGRV